MKKQLYVAIRDMSAGNDSVGEMWQETKIFSGESTIEEVMNWALDNGSGVNCSFGEDHSRKKVIVTKPHKNDKL